MLKFIAYLTIVVTLSATFIPCHAGEHEHHGTESHQHDSNDSSDDHPCSPFCSHHASFYSQEHRDIIQFEGFLTGIIEVYLFNYKTPQSELHDYSFWNPPKH